MKTLLVAEYRENKLLESIYECYGFTKQFASDIVVFGVGISSDLPQFDRNVKFYFADSSKYGEYNPDFHKSLLIKVIEKEKPEIVIFSHSSFGWDLAPRISALLKAPMLTEVVEYKDGTFVMPLCNNKLRRVAKTSGSQIVITLQGGAGQSEKGSVTPELVDIDADVVSKYNFVGYEEAEKKDVDLTKANIIVSAGRGVGKKENISIVESLANALGGELGSSRPVVDAGWVSHSRQVGTTGQTVSPKLYVACGISGAIQHLAGMKKSEKVIAINTDKDAPIGEVADLLVVADLNQFIPVLIENLKK
ncbi:MAG: electron transfer flavoprotein subunit alpha/FixB family protein [Calditerrivibrio sp.]|nr:electron transfer flavoprotein subunit alpha/FixB family protein [Calditerrivibrio sp.]MCA1933549.1 electron transfer flavoprotein subunit alpha/FixB family protein [Calditerrivibrio sp.]MCA1981186.1 electron transfer flavoprotein subunit alpha/FixB family protein [Calditerrivibrio sp.]